MKHSFLLLILLIWPFCVSQAQNALDNDGLKIGIWEEVIGWEHPQSAKGKYNILSIQDFQIIEKQENYPFPVMKRQYKGAFEDFEYSGKTSDKISVKDSIWHRRDSTGRIVKTTLWDNGIELNRKYYDQEGNLSSYDFFDYENDSSFYLEYNSNRLYLKKVCPHSGGCDFHYYPEDELIIETAVYPFFHNMLLEKNVVSKIRLSSKRDLVIQSIESSTGEIFAHLPNISLPFTLSAGDSIPLICEFAPTPLSFVGFDTIRIKTNEPNPVFYDIFCITNTAHIDGRNIRELDSIVLSKKKDGFLIINVLGSQTDIIISDETISRKYQIFGLEDPLRIDLADYQAGSYHVHIMSCSLWGDFTLEIRE